jgi:uncharacterized protein (DUF2132 family)
MDWMRKQLFDLFVKLLKTGERQYIADMETIDGVDFTISVKARSTEEALLLIEDLTVVGCRLVNIKIVTADGDIF